MIAEPNVAHTIRADVVVEHGVLFAGVGVGLVSAV